MMHILNHAGRRAVWLLLCGSCFSSLAMAQDVRPAGAEAARPAPLESEAVVSPELLTILQTWEQQSGAVTRSRGEFSRIEYDKIMATAKCAQGKYWFEGPDKGRMDFAPNEDVTGKQVKKRDLTFTCAAAEARWWICNGTEILDIDVVKKEYNRIEIPAQYQGKNIADGPLPFLFGMNALKMQQRYILDLGSLHDPKKIIHIIAYPKLAAEQREYRVAEVLLDPKTYLPQAVQLMDTTGNRETVYVFSKHDRVSGPWLPTSPWNPPMLFFKEITNQKAEPTPEREASRPFNTPGVMLR